MASKPSGNPVPLRISDAMLKRLDRIAQALSERAAGLHVARSDAIRLVMDRGADQLERELGLGTPTTKRRR